MAESARQFQKGSLAWIKFINSRGGINNNLIELITRDDSGDPELATKNTEFFILENFFMLYGYMGYESCIKSFEVSKKSETPFFGASTGAKELRYKGNNSFFIRPDHSVETQNMLEMLINHKKNKIALFYSNSNWAQSFAKTAEETIKAKEIKNFISASASKEISKIIDAAKKINSSLSEAVIIAAEPEIAASFIREIRKLNPEIIIIASSEVNGEKLSGRLMNQGVGVIISQVVPFPFFTKLPITQLYKRLSLEYFPEEPLSFFGLEGFISARAMTTALSECRELTKSNFIKTASTMKSINLGGFVFDLSDINKTGSATTYFTQIGPGGFLTPITSLDDIYKYNSL